MGEDNVSGHNYKEVWYDVLLDGVGVVWVWHGQRERQGSKKHPHPGMMTPNDEQKNAKTSPPPPFCAFAVPF